MKRLKSGIEAGFCKKIKKVKSDQFIYMMYIKGEGILMKLGGPLFEKFDDPQSWLSAVKKSGYSAVNCPVDTSAEDEEIKEYVKIADREDIIIAECGVWNNPLSNEENERKQAIKKCKETLELADRIKAECCVNIAGSCGEKWDGPHPDNFTVETFDRIVTVVRDIIDSVQPQNTYYTLEPMPWMYPDSPDSYLKLLSAIDRKQFAVHFDPVNIITSPQKYYNNGKFLQECFQKLGKHIKSCHAKDIIIGDQFTIFLKEERPGTGFLNYSIFLQELNKLNDKIPLMMEHLSNKNEYLLAEEYIRKIARKENIKL